MASTGCLEARRNLSQLSLNSTITVNVLLQKDADVGTRMTSQPGLLALMLMS
jgi:hypothetical protein